MSSTPTILVYLSHADPSVLPRYRAALAAAGLDADLVLVNAFVPGKLAGALRARGSGSILRGLAVRFPAPRPAEAYQLRIAASYSAGYGLWAELFASSEDLSGLDGYVAIDSFHAGLDADGTASDFGIAGLVSFALSARAGRRVCWYGHTDVQTPQKGPGAYASTTQVAAELLRLAGDEEGGFRVQAFDLDRNPATEHGHALTVWGPGFLASAAARLVELRTGEEEPAAEPPETASAGVLLGALALDLSREELLAGRGEKPPGSNAGPDIERYFSGCVRAGKPLPLRAGAWCAGAASWAAFQAAKQLPGRRVPHAWRASVLELWRDACSADFRSARSAAEVRAGRYIPQPGDLWIGVRGAAKAGTGPRPEDAFAPSKGLGHTGRFTTTPDGVGAFFRLDANHGSAWGEVEAFLADPAFVGVISYGTPGAPPAEAAIDGLRRLCEVEAGAPPI